jgi:hypothetical protein
VVWWRPAAPGYVALAIATVVWWRPAAPGYAALAIATDLDGLLRAGLCGFGHLRFLVGRNVFGHC